MDTHARSTLAGLRQISNPGISRGFLSPEEVAAASRRIPVRVRSSPTSCKQPRDPKGRLVGFARAFLDHVHGRILRSMDRNDLRACHQAFRRANCTLAANERWFLRFSGIRPTTEALAPAGRDAAMKPMLSKPLIGFFCWLGWFCVCRCERGTSEQLSDAKDRYHSVRSEACSREKRNKWGPRSGKQTVAG